MKRLWALLIAAMLYLPGVSQAQLVPLVDDWGWRAGGMMSGLFNSGQGRPFVYFDTGFRLKQPPFYVDVKLPVLVVGFDAAVFLFQSEALGIRSASDFVRLLNEEYHMMFVEAANLKLGRSFRVGDVDVNLGGALSLEFVFFQSLLQELDPEEFRGVDDRFAADPLVVMVGGFTGISWRFDEGLGMFDLAVGGGPDVFSFDGEYQPNSGFVFFLDGELVYEWSYYVGGYLRGRLSTYTHLTDPLSVTFVTQFGLLFRL